MATEITYQHVPTRQPGDHTEEVVRATLDTDSGGAAGPLTIALAGDYGAVPVVSADLISHSGDVTIANKTTKDLDASVANAPASTTVTVELIIRGEHGVS